MPEQSHPGEPESLRGPLDFQAANAAREAFAEVSGEGNERREVRFVPTEGFGRNIVRYDLTAPDGTPIGRLSLNYSAKRGTVEVTDVELFGNPEDPGSARGKGYGLAIYRMIASLPIPEGLPQQHYEFVSSRSMGTRNENSTGVWESLVRRGEAVAEGDAFRMLRDDERQ